MISIVCWLNANVQSLQKITIMLRTPLRLASADRDMIALRWCMSAVCDDVPLCALA
jgi:hypothetical protein